LHKFVGHGQLWVSLKNLRNLLNLWIILKRQ
jgi:hypothetical protein